MTNTNKKFNLTIIDGDVFNWTNEGEGDYIATKGMDLTTGLTELSRASIAKALEELTGAVIYPEDLFLENGTTGMINIIENADGEADDNGAYLVTYAFQVMPVAQALDLTNIQ